MVRPFRAAIFLLVVLCMPVHAVWPEGLAAFCRSALLAPIRAVRKIIATTPKPPHSSSNTQSRRQQAAEALQNWYGGVEVVPGQVRAHSFIFQIRLPDKHWVFAKVPTAVDSPVESVIAGREVAFLRLVQNQLPDFASNFPVVVDSFPIVLGESLPVPVVVLEKANRGALTHGLFFFSHYSPVEMVEAWMQISGPLAAVHAKWGISHADIKLQNVLLHENAGGELEIKIADWGLHHNPREPEAPSGGTPSYQSRATLEGRPSPELDDIQGAKLVFLQMVTGKHLTVLRDAYPEAFDGSNKAAVPCWRKVPGPLREQIAPALLDVLETDYVDVEKMHAALVRARALLRVQN